MKKQMLGSKRPWVTFHLLDHSWLLAEPAQSSTGTKSEDPRDRKESDKIKVVYSPHQVPLKASVGSYPWEAVHHKIICFPW